MAWFSSGADGRSVSPSRRLGLRRRLQTLHVARGFVVSLPAGRIGVRRRLDFPNGDAVVGREMVLVVNRRGERRPVAAERDPGVAQDGPRIGSYAPDRHPLLSR